MGQIAKKTLSGQENLPFWIILAELLFMVATPFNMANLLFLGVFTDKFKNVSESLQPLECLE